MVSGGINRPQDGVGEDPSRLALKDVVPGANRLHLQMRRRKEQEKKSRVSLGLLCFEIYSSWYGDQNCIYRTMYRYELKFITLDNMRYIWVRQIGQSYRGARGTSKKYPYIYTSKHTRLEVLLHGTVFVTGSKHLLP